MKAHTWVLDVRDWTVHALTEPRSVDDDPPWGVLATRCGTWHPVGCHVTVALRGEVCDRCAAGGLGRLELLPDRVGS